MFYFFLCILNCAQCVFNAGDGLPQQPEGAHEAVREEVELWEVGQRGIHCPGKKVEKVNPKTLTLSQNLSKRKMTFPKHPCPDASKQGGKEEGDGGDGEDEGADVGGGGEYIF